MDVINLEERRRISESAYDGLTCPCGEAWFTLDGAVCLTRDGTVTGYSGTLRCVSCGQVPGAA